MSQWKYLVVNSEDLAEVLPIAGVTCTPETVRRSQEGRLALVTLPGDSQHPEALSEEAAAALTAGPEWAPPAEL